MCRFEGLTQAQDKEITANSGIFKNEKPQTLLTDIKPNYLLTERDLCFIY